MQGLETYSTDPAFLDCLVPFAQATGTGSCYALWRIDERADLATLPVVVFSDDGDEAVIARNLRELLQLITIDIEPLIESGYACTYYRDKAWEHQRYHAEYIAWLDEHFGLSPIDDLDAAIGLAAAAHSEHGDRFANWVRQHCPDVKG